MLVIGFAEGLPYNTLVKWCSYGLHINKLIKVRGHNADDITTVIVSIMT